MATGLPGFNSEQRQPLGQMARVRSFEQMFWAAYFTHELLRLLQSAKPFMAHFVNFSVFGRTYLCCDASASFLETNWKWLEFPMSPRVSFFLPFGGMFSLSALATTFRALVNVEARVVNKIAMT